MTEHRMTAEVVGLWLAFLVAQYLEAGAYVAAALEAM